ncbi:hypothetical protein CAOG_08422, partial [Capsaspora owczarzaki ATCC 30864]|uniref:hypothetical protein n=1 Tax=Capsaspora owczarzaki (strain ATCC 30864) TaxID=595528 RepID=UPI0003522DC3
IYLLLCQQVWMLTSGVPFSGDPGDTNQSNGNGNSDAASAASSGRWSSGRTPAAPTTAPTTQLPSSPLASAQHHRARAIQSGGAAANADAHPFASTQPTAMLAEPWSHQGVHAMSSLERLRPRASPAAVTAEAAAEAATAAAAAATATVAASSSGSEAVTSGRSSVHHELVQVLPVHHAHASRDGPAHHHMYETGHAGSAAF